MISSSATDAPVPAGRVGAAVALLGAAAVVSVTFSVAVSSIAMGASFILLLLVVAREGAGTVPVPGLGWAFLFYVAAEVVSTVFSVDRADSLYNMKRVLLIGVVYVTAFSFRSARRVTVILAVLGLLGAVTAIIEIVNLRVVGGGIERPAMFQMPMTEGGIRMLISLLILPFVISRSVPPRVRILFAAALLPILAGLVVSQTRSAWVAFAAGAIVMGITWDRRVLAGLALLAVLFALAAPAEFRSRALSIVELQQATPAPPAAPDSITTTAESNSSRIQMIRTGWRMFLDRPVFGWGDIGLRPYYVTYVVPLTEGEGGHLHNNFMEALVTLGVPGFCAVGWLYYRMFRVIRRSGAGAPRDSYRAALAAGLLSAYAGFHVLGLFEYNFGDHEVMVLVWFMTGLAAAATTMVGDGAGGVAA
jgi:O-antigen ligase